MIHMSRERVIKALSEPNGPEKLVSKADQAIEPALELFIKENNAQACSFLARLAKQKKYRQMIENKLSRGRSELYAALESGDAKLRKNAARLIGALSAPCDADKLIEALEKEHTRFVRPSIILALGSAGGDRAKSYLASYKVAAPGDESEKRHFADETEALMTAKRRLASLPKHEFAGLKTEYEFELRAPDRLVGSLLYDIEESALDEADIIGHRGNCVFVKTKAVQELLKLRSMSAMFMPVAAKADITKHAALLYCRRFIKDFFADSCSGLPPYGYRIEIKGENVDRAAISKAMAAVIDSDEVVNSPSDYEIELIAEFGKKDKNTADIYARPTVFADKRFEYRVGALPASIHPATAAAVLRYAIEHMKVNARVLDPCCGSGTLLIEREKLAPVSSATGVDIAHKAIDIARMNAERAGSSAKFICNDMLRFEAKRPYDEVIANLPFGNRVGTHQANEKLYAGLLDKLPQWLNEDGVAILYTMEFTLLKKLIRERPGLKLVTETRTEAGGLMPGIFIIKLK